MKLVELLVKEIEEWPEDITYFVQDCDREVKAGIGSELSKPTDSGVWIRHDPLDDYNFYSGLCTDWQTSVVTKDSYTKHKEVTQMKRKVREDFNPAKEYSVDVEDCTVKEKEEVQQAFFDVGFDWEIYGESYKYTDAVKYTNTSNDGYVSAQLLYSLTTKGCNMTAEEFLELVYEPKQQGHIHAELMAQYAEDAKTHTEPWKLWQIKYSESEWLNCELSPRWDSFSKYRRKPKTHIVHGVEIPVFDFTPKAGERYYTANVGLPELFEDGYRSLKGCTFTQRMLERGLLYPYTEEGKQAAILHSKTMLGVA